MTPDMNMSVDDRVCDICGRRARHHADGEPCLGDVDKLEALIYAEGHPKTYRLGQLFIYARHMERQLRQLRQLRKVMRR
jgi:hypothetical protein